MPKSEKNEITKEIQNLKELSEKALDTLQNDTEYIKEMDANMEESNEFFHHEIETLEIPELEKDISPIETESPKKAKKHPWKALKEKWGRLSKKAKIGIIAGIILVVILIAVGIIFLLKNKKTEEKPKVPDVIVELENYRYQNGTLIFLDRKNQEIGEYTCNNQDQTLCYIVDYSDEDNFDEPKMIYKDGSSIPNRSKILLDRYVFLHDEKQAEDGLVILYDIKEQKDIDSYLLVKAYDALENVVVLKNKSNLYGMYRLTEEGLEKILPADYDYIGVIQNNKEEVNKVVTKQNGKWYLTDLENKTLTKSMSEEIKDYNDSAIKTIDDAGIYHVVDYNNNRIDEDGYDYIDLLDNYMLLIKDKKMYVRDYENSKMNMMGIELDKETYLQTSIYDQETKKRITTEQSYEITYQGSFMKVEVSKNLSKETKTINLNEGRVSKNLKYVDYLDGVLYFYSDEEKETLIGSYTCTNKNNMDDNTNNLTYCKIATESFYQENDVEADHKEELGTLPIYNNRYVFIYDTSSQDSEPTIHLYDFVESASKAKYKSLDAGAYTSANEINFVSTSNIEIMAENKNGKFGVIRITETNVEGVIDFNLNHIEKMGTKYIFQDDAGYYLADQEGKRESDSGEYKIRDYNETAKYVTRQKDDKYYLTPYKKEEVEEDKELQGYDYIALYDEYYATVNNKTLNLYSYEKPEYNFIEEGILLERENYYGEGTLAFRITFQKDSASIEVGTKEEKYNTPRKVSLVIKEPEQPVANPSTSTDTETKEPEKNTGTTPTANVSVPNVISKTSPSKIEETEVDGTNGEE